jgi:hypothetical protein
MWELICLGVIIVLLFWIKVEIGNSASSLLLRQTDLMDLQSKDLDGIARSTFLTQKRLTDLLVENGGHGNGKITYENMMNSFFSTVDYDSKLKKIHTDNEKIKNTLQNIYLLMREKTNNKQGE